VKTMLILFEALALVLSFTAQSRSEELDLSVFDPVQIAAAADHADELDLSILGCEPVAADSADELDLAIFGLSDAAPKPDECLDLAILGIDSAPLVKPRTGMLGPKPIDSGAIELQKFAPGQPQLQTSYPTHSQRWNVAGNWSPSREQLVAHLMGGQHAGKFSQSYLNGLSVAELKSLHDDDHEGRVQSSYVQQVATKSTAPAVTPATTTVRYASPCPGGKCPTYSYGYATTKAPRKGIFALFSRK
jgi:hypothetical protein